MLKGLQESVGVEIVNSPEGILLHNEKLTSYQFPKAVDSFVGSSSREFSSFIEDLKERGVTEIVLKPLDFYQGEGVEKISLHQAHLVEHFCQRVVQCAGPLVVQPFCPEIYGGEVRAIFFRGKELGSILKIPPQGDFLSTIARGAKWQKTELTKDQRQSCQKVCTLLEKCGIWWIAFDILGESIQEVNVTCPGLLAEVSTATNQNLAKELASLLACE